MGEVLVLPKVNYGSVLLKYPNKTWHDSLKQGCDFRLYAYNQINRKHCWLVVLVLYITYWVYTEFIQLTFLFRCFCLNISSTNRKTLPWHAGCLHAPTPTHTSGPHSRHLCWVPCLELFHSLPSTSSSRQTGYVQTGHFTDKWITQLTCLSLNIWPNNYTNTFFTYLCSTETVPSVNVFTETTKYTWLFRRLNFILYIISYHGSFSHPLKWLKEGRQAGSVVLFNAVGIQFMWGHNAVNTGPSWLETFF